MDHTSFRDQLTAHLEQYLDQRADKQLPDGGDSRTRISYGTAGFRGNAAQVEHLFYNVGLISGLRCLQLGANIGVMITASHNPVQDNGVKLIDASGEMLEHTWEPIVEQFCNTHEQGEILDQLDSIIKEHNVDLTKRTSACIMIGMDTRPSSEALTDLVKRGIEAWKSFGVDHLDCGLITTPALHYLVAESNRKHTNELSVQSYYDQLILGLADIFSRQPTSSLSSYSPSQLVVDCANGVGYETIRNMCNDDRLTRYLPIQAINIGDGILNKLCGADYVKTVQLPPSGADDDSKRYASLDGDADRVVYFYLERVNPSEAAGLKLILLDGDKIMALFALYLKDTLKKAGLDQTLSLGIVQTAYANGASTDYMTKVLGLSVDCVDTGVKNLHKQALNYDIGIYFEANGHGTIWLSEKARSNIENGDGAGELSRLLKIINNYTGDAISDILVVETILRYYDWDAMKWNDLYQDRPNSLIKVNVNDRSIIKTTNAARTCTHPEALQPAIDSLVLQFGSGARCFVRPSGTENVVRIYAEARDKAAADNLAASVGKEVIRICNAPL